MLTYTLGTTSPNPVKFLIHTNSSVHLAGHLTVSSMSRAYQPPYRFLLIPKPSTALSLTRTEEELAERELSTSSVLCLDQHQIF